LSDSGRLALQLFEYLQSPPKYADSLSAWRYKFAAALKDYSAEHIAAAMEFGFKVDDFWPAKLFAAAGKDPCDYFMQKLATLLTRHLGRTQAAENANNSVKEKKHPHGKSTGNGKTAGNQAAADETIAWLRQQQQQSDAE